MDKITEQLSLLPTDYRDFVMSSFSVETAEAIREEYKLPAGAEDTIQAGILNLLLFFTTEKEFINYLHEKAGLSRTQAEESTDALLALMPDSFPWQLISDDNLESEISALEETVSRLEPLRTMAGDMRTHEQELAHTSNQSDLLSQRAAGPGWETDNGT